MANYSETQFLTESTTFFTYLDSIVSTMNESMTEKLAESTILSTLLYSTTKGEPTCPSASIGCSNVPGKTKECINGICCVSEGNPHCVCQQGYGGGACQRRLPVTESISPSTGYVGAQLTAVISAFIGVLVISLFIGVVVLQFKYYKQRKKRLQKDEEIRKSMRVKPEIRRRDDASTRLLRTQPGYSWRQSVKRSTNASQKLKGLSMSISVPENLFEIGLTKEHEEETNQTKIGDVGGGGGGGGGRGGEGRGEGRGEAEGSERFRIDPTNDESEINSSSTIQLFQDKDPSKEAVQFQNKSDVVHL